MGQMFRNRMPVQKSRQLGLAKMGIENMGKLLGISGICNRVMTTTQTSLSSMRSFTPNALLPICAADLVVVVVSFPRLSSSNVPVVVHELLEEFLLPLPAVS